ncbi:MAG: hypothetical protein EA343_08435 [Nodularia sp. (in: Bacteria)]|nr:MAG: hypothetical protein EA343_08435 [Nodularia sp. (in: cyanobacteria)]
MEININFKKILIATCFAGFLAISMYTLLPNFVFADPLQLKETKQETIINLDIDELKENYFLKVSGSTLNTRLTGNIKLNGIIISEITDNSTEISISPLLKKGKNTVDITGSYTPTTSGFKVELTGPNTQISQENTGNGNIRNTLIIYVE